MKIILFANTDWYLYNFRRDLALSLREQGHEVILVSPPGEYAGHLQEMSFRWISFPLTRRGMNPLVELLSILRLVGLYKAEKPAVVHHNTIKCVLYGSIAAHLANVGAIVNSITGLGYIFLPGNWIKRLLQAFVRLWYRVVVKGTQVIFENPEDLQIFLDYRLIRPENGKLVRGAGVDVHRFTPAPEPPGPPVVLMAARMLWMKGVGEFISAARVLRNSRLDVRFALSGRIDDGNPASVSMDQIYAWDREGVIEWWGWNEDMPSVLTRSSIFCLPSYYREGVPTVLLEAAACGRPVITTDWPGCRDAVRDGVTGLIVPPRDAQALAAAVRVLLPNPHLRQQMGFAGRKMVIEEFSSEIVIQQIIQVYNRARQHDLFSQSSEWA